MGVSGLGAKPSLYIMSKKNGNPKTVYLFTHKEGGPFIKACIPFEQIKLVGRYSGMISYSNMTKEEETEFIEERKSISGKTTGTTIQWGYSETTHEYFESQFSSARTTIDIAERLDCIFGRKKVNILYKDYSKNELKKLPLYDYFNGERPEFYTGVKIDTIEHWIDRDNNDRFIWENNDSEYEFKLKAKGVGTKLERLLNGKNGWKQEGEYILKNAMRCDERLFDESKPTYKIKHSVCEKHKKQQKLLFTENFHHLIHYLYMKNNSSQEQKTI
jgi:hypothetical protein